MRAPSRKELIAIGVFAGGLEPRTIARYYTFGPDRMHPGSVQAIRLALARLGMADPHPGQTPAARVAEAMAVRS